MPLFDVASLGELVFEGGRGGSADVVVVIPLYNYENAVIEALGSVLSQSKKDVSIIVVDDCSCDSSIRSTISFLSSNAFRFIHAKVIRHRRNQGLSMSRNSGLAWTSEPYVFMLDADNRIRPPALSRLQDALEWSGAAFAYSQLSMFGQRSGLGVADIWEPAHLAIGNYIDAMALIRRDALATAGGYSVLADDRGWEDYDLWCRFAKLGLDGVFLPEMLCEYRVHGNSMTRTSTEIHVHSLISEMNLRHPEIFCTQRPSPFGIEIASKNKSNSFVRSSLDARSERVWDQTQISLPEPLSTGWNARQTETQALRSGVANRASCWSGKFDAEWYLRRYLDIAKAGVDPLEHYLDYGIKEGRHPTAADVPSVPVVAAKIKCLKVPSLGGEVALFVSYSPGGRLQPHVKYYVEHLEREGVSVLLVVNHDDGVAEVDDLVSMVDGLYLRDNRGYDFAAWAHLLRLHPELYSSQRLYLINDSVFGPTNGEAFSAVLRGVRESKSDIVGLTESQERGWHLQSYFLAIRQPALSSAKFKHFMSDVVAYDDKEDVIAQYELQLTKALTSSGFSCEGLFRLEGSEDPTAFKWKELLSSGFPFLKVSIAQGRPDAGSDGWREALSTRGYDITLADSTLKNRSINPIVDLRCWQSEVLLEPSSSVNLGKPLGIFVHIFYEELSEEIAAYLANIELSKRIYITTKPKEKASFIFSVFERHGLAGVTEIEVVPDYGTDIAPFIFESGKKFADHDICLKIHSKMASNEPLEFGEGWRRHLYRELMADGVRVNAIVNTMLAHPELGVMIPHHYPDINPESISIGVNYYQMRRILNKIGIGLQPNQQIEFPAGSMFWFRGKALIELGELGFDWTDFGQGVVERDGTLAHGMERCFLFFSAKAGMKWGFLPTFGTRPKFQECVDQGTLTE